MQSKARTVQEYLAELPPDRRAAIEAVRRVFLQNLDKDYEEGMLYGAIGYYVPHRVYPKGYHCDPSKPLPFAGLGMQKHYMSVGLMCHYVDEAEDKRFRAAWAKTGKKLDMGKCCIRFRKLDDLALDVLADAIRRVPARVYIERYERSIGAKNATPARKAPKAAKSRKKTARAKPGRRSR